MSQAEEAALLRAVVDNPHDDTVRLAYADWLDEHAGSASCPACCGLPDGVCEDLKGRIDELMSGGPWGDGIGAENTYRRLSEEFQLPDGPVGVHHVWQRRKVWYVEDCRHCGGTGLDRDDRRERAEFIRLQCGGLARAACLKPYPYADKLRCSIRLSHFDTAKSRTRNWCAVCVKATRETELGAVRAAGRRAGACPACKGEGSVDTSGTYGRAYSKCKLCWDGDVGGLLRRMRLDDPQDGLSPVDLRRPPRVDFARGFPDAVWCTLHDTLQRHTYRPDGVGFDVTGWRPSDWALAVVTHHPVTRFVVDDKRPSHGGSLTRDRFGWWCDSLFGTHADEPDLIPEIVWQEVEGVTEYDWKVFPTEAAANDALHAALARVARKWAAARKCGVTAKVPTQF